MPIFKVGVSTLIFQVLTSLSITLINNQTRGYGDFVIAGVGAVTRVTSMGSLMVFGFIKGFQSIAGYNYGAKNMTAYIRQSKPQSSSLFWLLGKQKRALFLAFADREFVLCRSS